MSDYEVVIGIEIHARLKTKSKLFSPDSAEFNHEENSNIHPVSLALPGTLPTVNKEAYQMALKTGKAFEGKLQETSAFARKNYFYPDIPKGYQISQHKLPFCQGGKVSFLKEGKTHMINLERIHLEEDSGRSIHKGESSLINFNRAGSPLLEIVTKPEIKSPEEASLTARSIRQMLRYLNVSDGDLEKGSLRCDCNISLRPKGETKLGVKVEIKNINSFRFVERALQFEIKRQEKALKEGEKISQETRLFDSKKGETRLMRKKESASDYRYFPEPDLPPVHFDKEYLANLQLPELPLTKIKRLEKDYSLKLEEAQILAEDKDFSDYFEELVSLTKDSRLCLTWLQGDVKARMKEEDLDLPKVSAQDLSPLITAIKEERISGKMGKEVFKILWNEGKKVEEIIKEKGFKQISSDEELGKIIDQVFKDSPSQLEAYKKGKTKLFSFFIGQAMKVSRGCAHPEKLNQILKKKLEE